jgi:S-methylmethionine-dependent homocysteine/selenocysteine methylase
MGNAIVLDGPVGTELALRGVATQGPAWSAHATDDVRAAAVLAQIHADWAAAGATVHTACTFRTQPRVYPQDWEARLARAVAIARGAVPPDHRVAGSLAPVADCYRPDLAPPPREAARLHAEVARALASAGVDLILCEAFPEPAELAVAVEAAAATGLPVWASLTAGPDGSLLAPAALATGAREAAARGANVVLVNCVDIARFDPFVDELAKVGAPFGAYANAGDPAAPPEAFADRAEAWARAGAAVVGACCYARPSHVAAVARRLASIRV